MCVCVRACVHVGTFCEMWFPGGSYRGELLGFNLIAFGYLKQLKGQNYRTFFCPLQILADVVIKHPTRHVQPQYLSWISQLCSWLILSLPAGQESFQWCDHDFNLFQHVLLESFPCIYLGLLFSFMNSSSSVRMGMRLPAVLCVGVTRELKSCSWSVCGSNGPCVHGVFCRLTLA